MDIDDSGFVEESEMQRIWRVVFKDSAEDCVQRWYEMDRNHDNRVSKEEYQIWWAKHHEGFLLPNGIRFQESFARELLQRLQRLRKLKEHAHPGGSQYGSSHSHGKSVWHD